MNFKKKFPILGNTGEEISFLQLTNLWADVYGIQIKKTEEQINVNLLTKAFAEALAETSKEPIKSTCRQIMFRLIKGQHSPELGLELSKLGFHKKHNRVEFKKDLAELPDDKGSPLTWKTAEELNFTSQDIAKIISEIAVGDPDYSQDEDPLLFIQDFINHDEFTHGLNCIHFGFYNNEIAAMTVAQIEESTGWSRISYMGVHPKFRNLGLGKWLHRYGFVQMRAQGGKLYHGGTVSTNTAMIKLFLNHGCEQFREMEEWIYECK